MKSVLDILVENLKIGTSGFSNEKQIYGIFKCVEEIENKQIKELKEMIGEKRLLIGYLETTSSDIENRGYNLHQKEMLEKLEELNEKT